MKILIAQQAQDPTGNLISTIVMFGAIFAIFYFMVMRPQQKRAKEREKMLANVQKGDKVVTSGGLHGTVAGMEDNIIILQVSDNVKLKFEKAAITTVLSK
ncbi:MAG: preprotein translocase subunit YajC [Ignavibacteriales bacterium]|nr:Sec translocon accessory complex subunit YajC [Ignavibacteriaceae bacterium]MCK6612781.1 preprotein translocase subunit YajC [Ignavibacteriaceae bacterium]QOJ29494.1 MAG: preprotein translocase subunit YajC [Ignavibacteriales bacterium]